MSSKRAQRRWIVGLVLAVAVGVVAVIVLGVGHQPPALASTAVPMSSAAAQTVQHEGPTSLHGVAKGDEPSPELAPDDRAAVAGTAASDVAAETASRVILRGRIDSPRDDLSRAEIEVSSVRAGRRSASSGQSGRVSTSESSSDPPGWMRAPAGADGRFELDVTAVAREVVQLHVIGRHPALKTVTELVSTEPARLAKPGARTELAVVLRMVDSMCRVRGRVTTDSGEALSTTIAAFELSDDGTRVAASAEVVESTRKQGAFELELSVQPHVLLAFARDWRPATVRIACSEGETLELSPIVLDRGFSISGQALLGSAPFAAGMIVIADLDRPVSTVNAGTSSFVWTGERFEWPRRQARANELGLFEITALGDRVYSVRLLGVGDPGTPMLLDAQSVSVLAPASDVEISPGLCELHVAVYKSGVPAEQRLAIREAIGRFSERFSEFATDKSGHATMWVSPNYPAELIVDRATRNERVFSLPSCTANGSAELRIDL